MWPYRNKLAWFLSLAWHWYFVCDYDSVRLCVIPFLVGSRRASYSAPSCPTSLELAYRKLKKSDRPHTVYTQTRRQKRTAHVIAGPELAAL